MKYKIVKALFFSSLAAGMTCASSLSGPMISIDLPSSIIAEADEIQREYVEIQTVMDADRHVLEESYLDAESNLVDCEYGYAIVRYEYDEQGNKVRETFFSKEDRVVDSAKGYAFAAYSYYESGKIEKENFFDASGKPVILSDKGYASVSHEYNSDNFEIGTRYYDENGYPMEVKGAARLENIYDENGNVTIQKKYNLSDELVIDAKGFAWVEKTYNDQKQCIL